MGFRNWILAIIVGTMVTCGCSKTMVVLVPDPDGSVGAVRVDTQKGSVDLDEANQATQIQRGQAQPGEPEILAQDKIDTVFSEVLAVPVKPPVHFLLYFQDDSSDLKPESLRKLPEIIDEIRDRQSVRISIVGHSDTTGNTAYNLKLSTRRAEAVSRLLTERGVQPAHITTTSHGEENPLVQTGDNVSEPKNRRVEVIVR